MKNLLFLFVVLLLNRGLLFSQIAINADGSAPDASAALDIGYTNKGFLPPRLTQDQIKALPDPADGLMVYCTTDSKLYIYSGASYLWKEVTFGTGIIAPTFSCGNPFTKNHVEGTVAPVNKTVTYGTITNIPGETSKCWISQNLGADHQAIAVDDATEESAGWYWQFNRMQGYKHDGTTVTPSWTITEIDENSDWLTANDPCALLLGNGWRLPTSTEWINVDNIGGWTNWNGPWNSALKMHAAGYLNYSDAFRESSGTLGNYWSSTQYLYNNLYSWFLEFNSSICSMANSYKAQGFSARCLRDTTSSEFTCGDFITVNHVTGDVAPVTKAVTYETITNIPGETSKCWITQNLGADHQAIAVNDTAEASAGWYWQFNLKQGYKHNGITRTPNSVWITGINENSDWLTANDPCALLLGSGWRLPTYIEWNNVDNIGGWTDWNGAWNSALKLHAPGFISSTGLAQRGTAGYYWSCNQNITLTGWDLTIYNENSLMQDHVKEDGFSVRCIRD